MTDEDGREIVILSGDANPETYFTYSKYEPDDIRSNELITWNLYIIKNDQDYYTFNNDTTELFQYM